MQSDPAEEWQRLSALYAEMGDIELRELAYGIGDLTETAQRALRDELRKRRIPENPPPIRNVAIASQPDRSQWESSDDSPQSVDTEEDSPHEYTWKTPLCECETSKQAWQLVLALREAGIDSWFERARSSLSYPRVLVAADQLDEAQQIAASPIPQTIADDMNEEPALYEPPVCPKCGASDPTLESADPSNSWHCESCANDWTDPIADPGADAASRVV